MQPSKLTWSSTASLCHFCRLPQDEHVAGKCLFDSTQYAPMSVGELRAYHEDGVRRAQDILRTLTMDFSKPWDTPVYPVSPPSLALFAVCAHCGEARDTHIGDEAKCLFSASTFAVFRSLKK